MKFFRFKVYDDDLLKAITIYLKTTFNANASAIHIKKEKFIHHVKLRSKTGCLPVEYHDRTSGWSFSCT